MKQFKLTIALLLLFLVIIGLAGIYEFNKGIKPLRDSNITTNYFGNEVSGDLNGDGKLDRAFIITEETGGSGTFFYLTALLKSDSKEISAGKIFLGDRIAPQSTNFEDGIITVNFADRKLTDSFVVAPSIGKSLRVIYDKQVGQIIDITSSSSSDAIGTSTAIVSPKPDPSKIKITDKPWMWVKTVYNDGKVVDPKIKDAFEITFIQDGRFTAKTDCNSIGGEYTFTENKITLDKMVSTLMYCDQSQESEFAKMLGEVDNFLFSKDGELVLGLKFDSGSIILR
jgi:heat shock protein HslJ